MSVKKLNHSININKLALEDVTTNQKYIIPETFQIISTDIKLFTDVPSVGFGAIYDNASFAIVMAWGSQWEGKHIIFVLPSFGKNPYVTLS